jgi:hypothetical protein
MMDIFPDGWFLAPIRSYSSSRCTEKSARFGDTLDVDSQPASQRSVPLDTTKRYGYC